MLNVIKYDKNKRDLTRHMENKVKTVENFFLRVNQINKVITDEYPDVKRLKDKTLSSHSLGCTSQQIDILKIEMFILTINQINSAITDEYFEVVGLNDKVLIRDYFETTLHDIDVQEIIKLRLVFHESLNDYLMKTMTGDLPLLYRVKSSERIQEKIKQNISERGKDIKEILNDILGFRLILNSSLIEELLINFERFKKEYGLINLISYEQKNYRGLHLYFEQEGCLPWELQIWDEKDLLSNIEYKRYVHK